MTLSAQRHGDDEVEITSSFGFSNGPLHTYKISENASHVRSFWSQLGRVLDEIEQKGE